MRILLNWILSALAVWIVAHVVPGFYVSGFTSALIAALVIGFINALMLEFASALLSPGFQVRGFLAAFLGAILLSLVNMLLKALVRPSVDQR